ncbi:MAG TPA: DUF484 family protein [Stellaceae bacterium]|nr:DUF484 family protein [Stellaceae bacterium]
MPDRPRDRTQAEPLGRLVPEARPPIDGGDVITYLRAHPEFLDDHPEALALLRPPSREIAGGVVDFQHFLLERQRRDLAELNTAHRALIATTRGNLASQGRIHKAVLAILSAATFEQLFQTVTTDLAVLLDVDVVTIAVESDATMSSRPTLRGIHLLKPGTVDALLGADKPAALATGVAGDPALFGGGAGLVRSQALLRLGFGKSNPTGLLCIGTRKPGRFHPGLGTELLSFLARALSITIAQWLKPR